MLQAGKKAAFYPLRLCIKSGPLKKYPFYEPEYTAKRICFQLFYLSFPFFFLTAASGQPARQKRAMM
jgi:hypothetical protein